VSARRRLLILYETLYPATIGGIERRNLELAATLSRRGHRVTLAGLGAAGPTRALLPPEVEVCSLGVLGRPHDARGRRSLRHTVHFARLCQRLDLTLYDVVETANQFYLHLFPLARACRRAGRPLAVTWYEFWGGYWRHYVGGLQALFARRIERAAARRGDLVAATCDLTAVRLQQARRGAVARVPCGVDVKRIADAAAGGTRGAPLVHAGRLMPHKRVDLLLRAVALLERSSTPPIEPLLTVFGDGPEREPLQRLARDLGLGSRVEFRGFLPESRDLWHALGGARVAVQASEREGFGLFPLEAMAAGLPVVYCRSTESAVGELVRDGVEGVACEPDARALAGSLDALLREDDRRQAYASAARRRAEQYDWDIIGAQFEDWALAQPASR